MQSKTKPLLYSFSSLLDIDKLIPNNNGLVYVTGFSSLLDIDKLIRYVPSPLHMVVLVLCWILINLYLKSR